MTRWLSTLLAAAAVAAPAAAQLPPDKILASMKTAPGVQVGLFAAEPMLVNPTAIDIDHLGRVWVAEAVNYRRINFKRPILRPEGDRIVILADTDGDGKADTSTVFYQGPELYGPLGVCVVASQRPDRKGGLSSDFSYKVYVAQSPDILLFEDKDGDGKADGPPTKFLTGVGGFDHDHGVHGLSVGPDGKLYFTVGDTGVKNLQSTDGKGPKYNSNSTDCRAGTVWRCDLDGKNLELIAHNFRNNYEACVNSFGEIWLSDNDDDGNQQTRICFVMPGGNYGYHPRGKGESHWHEEQPGIVHKTLRTGFGSPTGITFYEGNLFGKPYQGQLLHCDAGPREVRCFHIKPKGAGYELDKEVMLTSSDNWFRPSAVRVAPDGSIFVADWYDPGVGGHGMGDWTRGRIYRLTPTGHTGYKVPEVKLNTPSAQFTALMSPNTATRALAMASYRGRTLDQMFAALRAGASDKPTALDESRMTWLLPFVLSDPETAGKCARDLVESSDANLRAMPWRELQVYYGRVREFLEAGGIESEPLALLNKSDSAVRREALLLLRLMGPSATVKPAFYALAKLYDGHDIFYRAALNIACGTDPARRDAILADFDKHFPEWNDKVADLVWELRPKSVMPRLAKLLSDPKLTGPQKARIVDILAGSDDASAGTAVLGLLATDARAEVKNRALDHLRMFLPGKWSGLGKTAAIRDAAGALLADGKTRATGLQLVAAAGLLSAIDGAEQIAADEAEPLDVRKEAVRTLGQLKDAKAVAALTRVGAPENPLSVPAVEALAEQLNTGGKPTEAGSKALAALQTAVALDKATPALKAAALQALAGTRAGTTWLLQLREKGQMAPGLVADAGRLLRNSPFQGERNKAFVLFPAAGKLDPKKLPSPADLARKIGNPDNGKAILAKSAVSEAQCLKCHMVRGGGGQIGPDLSVVGKKGLEREPIRVDPLPVQGHRRPICELEDRHGRRPGHHRPARGRERVHGHAPGRQRQGLPGPRQGHRQADQEPRVAHAGRVGRHPHRRRVGGPRGLSDDPANPVPDAGRLAGRRAVPGRVPGGRAGQGVRPGEGAVRPEGEVRGRHRLADRPPRGQRVRGPGRPAREQVRQTRCRTCTRPSSPRPTRRRRCCSARTTTAGCG